MEVMWNRKVKRVRRKGGVGTQKQKGREEALAGGVVAGGQGREYAKSSKARQGFCRKNNNNGANTIIINCLGNKGTE